MNQVQNSGMPTIGCLLKKQKHTLPRNTKSKQLWTALENQLKRNQRSKTEKQMHPEHGNDRNTDSQNQQMTDSLTNMGNGETIPNSPNRTQIITHSNRTDRTEQKQKHWYGKQWDFHKLFLLLYVM